MSAEQGRFTLLKTVEIAHGTEVADTVSNFFSNAALTAPLNDEFFRSCDSGLMVFLEDEACILRFISPRLIYGWNDNVMPITDPDILQPFGIKKLADDFYFEIVPGVKCGTPIDVYKTMIERLIAKGYRSSDLNTHSFRNSGLLPDNTPVIIDRGSVRRLTDAVENVKIALGSQSQIFGTLKETFNQAWPEGQQYPDREEMLSLWAKCREMKKSGILVDGWNSITKEKCYNISDVREAASAYHEHRLDENPVPIVHIG